MGLSDLLRQDMQKAAKEKNPLALSALRMALAEIKNKEIEARGPLSEEAILKTVAKTHRVVLVDENKPFCGVSAQIAAMIQEQAFDDLDAPVQRVCSLDAPAIYSPALEKIQLPTPERVVYKALQIL